MVNKIVQDDDKIFDFLRDFSSSDYDSCDQKEIDEHKENLAKILRGEKITPKPIEENNGDESPEVKRNALAF